MNIGLIENLAKALKDQTNPSMDGWLLEMWFFALKFKDVKVYDDFGNELNSWRSERIEMFDPTLMDLNTIQNLPKYLKPIKWNQGGYDAIYLENDQIEFIQITRGSTHSLKLEYFSQFLENLKNIPNSTFKAKEIAIYFVIPKTVKNFKVNQVTGRGLLEIFDSKWKMERKKILLNF